MMRCLDLLRVLLSLALIALLQSGVAASAADIGGQRKPPGSVPVDLTGQGKASREGGSVAPLKGVIRLKPGNARAGGSPRIPTLGFGTLEKKFAEFSGNAKAYESGAKTMPQVAKQCSDKGFTVQDQKAAGCTGSESLDQCMEKLYKYCVQNYSVGGGFAPSLGFDVTGAPVGGGKMPGFSTQEFLQRTKTAAAQARALGQLLNQYANEAEQNAKALVP